MLGKQIINLDKFKPFFKNCLKLKYELGFNIYYNKDDKDDKDTINFEVSKGFEGHVIIPYSTVIGIHTHPDYLYKSNYKPPTYTDYIQSIFDHFHSKSINIVIEDSGMWLYELNRPLIEEVISIEPNIKELLAERLQEGEPARAMNVSDQMYDLVDVLKHNSNNSHLNLVLNKRLVIEMILNQLHKEQLHKENDERLKTEKSFNKFIRELEEQDMDILINTFGIERQKISLNQYIQEIGELADNMGFIVRFIPWSEPFEFVIDIEPKHLEIFQDIKERGLNVFDERDTDIIKDIANHTREGRLLRK